MKFWEAMKLLEEGKKVRHVLMEPGAYIKILPDGELLRYRTESYSPLMAYITTEWELYEEPAQLLSFPEVVKGLKEGKMYRREGWKHPVHGYNMKGAIRYVDGAGENSGQKHFFSIEDFEANDWIEVKE